MNSRVPRLKHRRSHPQRNTRVLRASWGTNRALWPSHMWLRQEYWPYIEACSELGVRAIEMSTFYRSTLAKGQFRRAAVVYTEVIRQRHRAWISTRCGCSSRRRATACR